MTDGVLPIVRAASAQEEEVVGLLLAAGADLDACTPNGQSARSVLEKISPGLLKRLVQPSNILSFPSRAGRQDP